MGFFDNLFDLDGDGKTGDLEKSLLFASIMAQKETDEEEKQMAMSDAEFDAWLRSADESDYE